MTPTFSGKPIQVLVVDDSAVVRGFVVRCLTADPRVEIVGSCSNGEMAVAQVARKKADVIVLDIEMPVMDGIEALPKLLQACPGVQIVMASTLTQRNAAITMRALSLGAADYIAKPATNQLRASEEFGRELIRKVVALGNRVSTIGVREPRSATPPKLESRPSISRTPALIAIGSSTGGPKALLTLLGNLSPAVKCPIVIAQHMPPTFTTVLAQHIAQASGRPCREAEDGMAINAGAIYLAPGDYHLVLAAGSNGVIARLNQAPPENFCRPSVDPLFRTVAKLFGPAGCAVVLTGMGSDGCAGARVMAAGGATILAQDEATSVVWGMPGAVAQAGICTAILPLPRIAGYLTSLFRERAA
jgi:two-component system chemotaxis response regulator CheB